MGFQNTDVTFCLADRSDSSPKEPNPSLARAAGRESSNPIVESFYPVNPVHPSFLVFPRQTPFS